jgi:hypothetical protein
VKLDHLEVLDVVKLAMDILPSVASAIYFQLEKSFLTPFV